jgi:Rps23 Pro-64 3,4-dihydroxylase Tpa1-like proline 4-hydroxylase
MMSADFLTPPPEEIKVTILLTGGHDYTVSLPADAPLLRQLFEVLVDQTGNGSKILFQVPVSKGRGMLCFPGDRLVGVVTEPSVIIQHQPQSIQPTQPIAPTGIIPSTYIQLDNFLTPEDHYRLLVFTLEKEAAFVSTNTSTGDENYRKSVVLHSFPEFSELMTQRIQQVLPEVFAQLGMTPFSVSQIETQLTGHNDGNYYKIHNDNGSSETATRELTYVYYFYREPKSFSGGELLIYDSRIENNYYVEAESFHTVDPRNNSIIFFLSRYMHEVLPVHCPSRAFADSRFTINGWVRR